MDYLDISLMRAAIYVGIFCLEIRRAHGRVSRALLALCLLLLALLAACESDNVRNFRVPVIEMPPVFYELPAGAPIAAGFPSGRGSA